MNSETYVTHKRDDGTYQLLKDHLLGVATLSAEFARGISSPLEGYRTGLLHDIGKYSPEAQQRQRDPEHTQPVDHATAGMQAAAREFRDIPAAFAIAGHHGGLPDNGLNEGTIASRVRKRLTGRSDPGAWKKEISPEAKTDTPAWVIPESRESAMYTRMLFSCLVDADFLDTEAALQGEKPRGRHDNIPSLLARLRAYVAPWLEHPRDALCTQRNTVLERCLAGDRQPLGLYTLTVPTGGGKTLASLAFALSHAAAHKLKRVIYVIPYTSIIEQTADIFAAVLGRDNVLEHHSQAETDSDAEDAEGRRRLACENWDAPVIVTTAVQFFESLYARKPSRCRKLHNIAQSVIVFDEAQTLPLTLLRPCVSAMAELVRHYGATALLCTATQPALGKLFAEFAPELNICELAPDPDALFDFFRRVRFAREGSLTDAALAERLEEDGQVLCVVNSRKRARDVFMLLPEEGRYHLSTLMTAQDRERTLRTIRDRLRSGEVCRVVSTSLIEAGVDVDFPTVWREMSGLDSILQAAGRCNREGLRAPEDSLVHVFSGEGKVCDALLARIIPAKEVMEAFEDINSRPAIEAYFRKLLWAGGPEGLDKMNILDMERKWHFRQVAEHFHMIDDHGMKTVYIPSPDNEEALRLLRLDLIPRDMLRSLGRSAVSLPWYEYDALVKSAAMEDHPTDGYGILLNPDAYDGQCGLNVRSDGGAALFF